MQQTPYRIVLIDDDLDMHDVVRLILPGPVYAVHCATTASTGWALIENHAPDVLLLDIMLATPTEGLEIAARLRSDTRFSRLPIIFVSAAPPEFGCRALPQGTRLLEKPLEVQELRTALREVLR